MKKEKRYDYSSLIADIDSLTAQYGFVRELCLGESLFGRRIPILRLGTGCRNIVYVGSHHGMESVTSAVLMKYAKEYCEHLKDHRRIFGLSPDYMYATRSIFVIPMLNPDGVELSVNGLGDCVPLKERLIRMNGGSEDFTRWQANGRGVDLNHNYDAGFAEYKALGFEDGIEGGARSKYSGEYPESEPETKSLCNLIRSLDDVKLVVALHTQGEEIYAPPKDMSMPMRSELIGRQIANMTGYKLAFPEGSAAYGGFKDWFVREFSVPGFTIECGKGENPLPPSSLTGIYASMREALFSMPALC